MPSRFGTLAIVVFWLASMTWLTVREIVPTFRAGEPPAFLIDVTDEVGGTATSWKILRKGVRIGDGYSHVRRRSDRTFELSSELSFQDKELPLLKTWDIKKIAGRYRVDKNGNLQSLETEVKLAALSFEIKAEIKGEVKGGVLTPRIYLDDKEKNLGPFQPQPVPVASHGSILNTMHMVNKIQGLYVGRTWKVPLLDPLGSIVPGRKATPSILIAQVSADNLDWQGEAVPCFRIDYYEPGKEAAAHTWVRRRDGLVLQQEANRDEMDLVLVREVAK
jgi:hypothetical protein